MAKTLPKRHAGSPLRTNASLNRDCAVACFKAGLSVQAIAAAWPEVFMVTSEHGEPRLGLRYDYELADGSGRYEQTRRITEQSLRDVLAAHTRTGRV